MTAGASKGMPRTVFTRVEQLVGPFARKVVQSAKPNQSSADYLGLSAQRFSTKSVCRLLSNLSVRLLSWTMGTIQPFQSNLHLRNVLHPTPELVNWFSPTTQDSFNYPDAVYTVRVTLTEVWMLTSRPGLRTNMMWVWSRLLRHQPRLPARCALAE